MDAVKEMLEALAERFPESEALKAAFRSLERPRSANRTLRERDPWTAVPRAQIQVPSPPRSRSATRAGSALFQWRDPDPGITLLAVLRMEQQIDNLSPVNAKRYMHQYNFAPFSTGELALAPEAPRDHYGDLAERACSREFPYAIRQSRDHGLQRLLVDGFRHASTLSLLQAGVPCAPNRELS